MVLVGFHDPLKAARLVLDIIFTGNRKYCPTIYIETYPTILSCLRDLRRVTSWQILAYSLMASSWSVSMSSTCLTAISSPVMVRPRNTYNNTSQLYILFGSKKQETTYNTCVSCHLLQEHLTLTGLNKTLPPDIMRTFMLLYACKYL